MSVAIDNMFDRKWFVYLVTCSDDTLYCGISTCVKKRVADHNAGRGAKYTRTRRPVHLAHVEPADSHSAALRREIAIKRLSRQGKLQLIQGAKL
jgi:putative endonuclease